MVGKSEGDASLQPFGDQLEERLGLPRYLCLTFLRFWIALGHGLALKIHPCCRRKRTRFAFEIGRDSD